MTPPGPTLHVCNVFQIVELLDQIMAGPSDPLARSPSATRMPEPFLSHPQARALLLLATSNTLSPCAVAPGPFWFPLLLLLPARTAVRPDGVSRWIEFHEKAQRAVGYAQGRRRPAVRSSSVCETALLQQLCCGGWRIGDIAKRESVVCRKISLRAPTKPSTRKPTRLMILL
jgi:hypothetical protein